MSRTSLITAEIIILIVTWIATYKRGMVRRRRENNTLAHVVLFNGEFCTPLFLLLAHLTCLVGTTYFMYGANIYVRLYLGYVDRLDV